MKDRLSMYIEDLITALKKGKLDLAKVSLQLILTYLEYGGFFANTKSPLIISYVNNYAPFELNAMIEKLKQGKDKICLDDGITIYYSDEEVLVEIIQNSSEKSKMFIILKP